MADSEKPKFEPGATMQIDLDQVQLVDLEAGKVRSKPPPLPPEPPVAPVNVHAAISQPPPPPSSALPPRSAAPTPPPSAAKNVLYVGIIIVVVAVAIVAGLAVGRGVRGGAAPAPSAGLGAPSSSQTAPPVESTNVLTIPPVEVK
jgi:hypothetical protein